jgi:hypothetical protein
MISAPDDEHLVFWIVLGGDGGFRVVVHVSEERPWFVHAGKIEKQNSLIFMDYLRLTMRRSSGYSTQKSERK